MQKGDYLQTLLRSKKTVLTFDDVLLLWQDNDTNAVKARINYYVKKGDLVNLRRGIYAKDNDYNPQELATRVFTPSYISFETVLSNEGIIFQYYSKITVASYLTREIEIDDQVYSYRKIKNSILTNNQGVIVKNNISIADKHRALLDILYLNPNYYFDNLRQIDYEKINQLLPIYKNKKMETRVCQLFEGKE